MAEPKQAKPIERPRDLIEERSKVEAEAHTRRRVNEPPIVTDAAVEAIKAKAKPLVTDPMHRAEITSAIGSASAYTMLAHACCHGAVKAVLGVLEQDPEADVAHAIDACESALKRLREAVPLIQRYRTDRINKVPQRAPTPEEDAEIRAKAAVVLEKQAKA